MLQLKHLTKNHFVHLTITLTACMALTGCYFEAPSTDLEVYSQQHPEYSHEPQIQMMLNDFKGLTSQTLTTNAIPLKIAATAVITKRHQEQNAPIEKKTFNNALAEYGFIIPEKIENLKPGVPAPKFEYPLGVIRGDLEMELDLKVSKIRLRAEVTNLTCALCHAGRTYDQNGMPTNNVWLGTPNTSINLQGYTNEVYGALKYIRSHRKDFFNNLTQVYPEISKQELKSIQNFLFDKTAEQISQFENGSDTILAYLNGPPGGANSIGSFKRVFGIYKPGDFNKKERGYANIPDLGYRAFRRNLTVDGIYVLSGEKSQTEIRKEEATLERAKELGLVAAIFPIPIMGVSAEITEKNIPRMKEMFGGFIYNYQSMKFPGEIKPALATAGEVVYRQSCMKCHGEYSAGIDRPTLISYPNKKIPQEKINTDPTRLDVVTPQLVEKMEKTWIGKQLTAEIQRAYMAPILSSVWSTAPYLHNGSVPTLWDLMNPSERPSQFYVGGHAIDFEKVGIIYRPGMQLKSKPVLVDTNELGLSNKGHEKPFDQLSQDQKKALIEYLKLL